MRILAIDDVRECTYANVVARTHNDGIAMLEKFGPWDELYLDHDLGARERQYDNTGRELTGNDILVWLRNNLDKLPKKIILITGNPVGRKNMEATLSDISKLTKTEDEQQ